MMTVDIKSLFEYNEGYLTRQQIPGKSSYNHLLKMIAEGVVVRVKPGVYSYNDIYSGTMIDVERIVSGGVLCLFSTWLHYGLSVSIPHAFNIAIERGRKVKLPDYPPIQLYHWTKEYYELGITTEKIYDFTVKIYDIEKSVCDAIKFRNKVGIDVTAEILKNYLRRQSRNLVKLSDYAKQMRIEKTLKTYLEIGL